MDHPMMMDIEPIEYHPDMDCTGETEEDDNNEDVTIQWQDQYRVSMNETATMLLSCVTESSSSSSKKTEISHPSSDNDTPSLATATTAAAPSRDPSPSTSQGQLQPSTILRIADPGSSSQRMKQQQQQRSVSQPRSRTGSTAPPPNPQQQHFLQGYNMDNFRLDVRSIPDPPSPTPEQRQRSRSRSHSRSRTSMGSSPVICGEQPNCQPNHPRSHSQYDRDSQDRQRRRNSSYAYMPMSTWGTSKQSQQQEHQQHESHLLPQSKRFDLPGKASLEDVTNQKSFLSSHNLPPRPGNLLSSNNNIFSTTHENSVTRKSKRKTMLDDTPPLPSSSMVSSTNTQRQTGDETKEQPPLQFFLGGGDDNGEEEEEDDDDINVGVSRGNHQLAKRRKKRQSMVLPFNELPLQEDVNAFIKSSPQHDTSHHVSPSSMSTCNNPTSLSSSSNNVPSKCDLASMRKLQELVRNYTSKSHSDRQGSLEGTSIRQMTGYALSGTTSSRSSMTNDSLPDGFDSGACQQSKVPLTLEARRRLAIEKLGPVLQDIERRKVEDKQKWETATGCRVTKSSKSGKYKYISISSGLKVGSKEYKRCYMDVLEQEKPVREATAREWMDRLVPMKEEEDETNVLLDCSSNTDKLSKQGAASSVDDAPMDVCYPQMPTIGSHTGMPCLIHSISLDQHELCSRDIPSNTIPMDVEGHDEITQREAFVPPKDDLNRNKVNHQTTDQTQYPNSDLGRELEQTELSPRDQHSLPEPTETIEPIAATVSNSELDEPTEINEAPSDDNTEKNRRTSSVDSVFLSGETRLVSTSPRRGVSEDSSHNSLVLDSESSLMAPADRLGTSDLKIDYPAKVLSDTCTTSRRKSPARMPLLPIPSRDQSSTDPQIAMAEQRLWERIDAALREYSREVMDIKSGGSIDGA